MSSKKRSTKASSSKKLGSEIEGPSLTTARPYLRLNDPGCRATRLSDDKYPPAKDTRKDKRVRGNRRIATSHDQITAQIDADSSHIDYDPSAAHISDDYEHIAHRFMAPDSDQRYQRAKQRTKFEHPGNTIGKSVTTAFGGKTLRLYTTFDTQEPYFRYYGDPPEHADDCLEPGIYCETQDGTVVDSQGNFVGDGTNILDENLIAVGKTVPSSSDERNGAMIGSRLEPSRGRSDSRNRDTNLRSDDFTNRKNDNMKNNSKLDIQMRTRSCEPGEGRDDFGITFTDGRRMNVNAGGSSADPMNHVNAGSMNPPEDSNNVCTNSGSSSLNNGRVYRDNSAPPRLRDGWMPYGRPDLIKGDMDDMNLRGAVQGPFPKYWHYMTDLEKFYQMHRVSGPPNPIIGRRQQQLPEKIQRLANPDERMPNSRTGMLHGHYKFSEGDAMVRRDQEKRERMMLDRYAARIRQTQMIRAAGVLTMPNLYGENETKQQEIRTKYHFTSASVANHPDIYCGGALPHEEFTDGANNFFLGDDTIDNLAGAGGKDIGMALNDDPPTNSRRNLAHEYNVNHKSFNIFAPAETRRKVWQNDESRHAHASRRGFGGRTGPRLQEGNIDFFHREKKHWKQDRNWDLAEMFNAHNEYNAKKDTVHKLSQTDRTWKAMLRQATEPRSYQTYAREFVNMDKPPVFAGALLRGVDKTMTLFQMDTEYLYYFSRDMLDPWDTRFTNRDKLIKVCRLSDIYKVIIHRPPVTRFSGESKRQADTMTLVYKPYLETSALQDEYASVGCIAQHTEAFQPNPCTRSRHVSLLMNEKMLSENSVQGMEHCVYEGHPGNFYHPSGNFSDFDRIMMRYRPSYTPKNLCRNVLNVASQIRDMQLEKSRTRFIRYGIPKSFNVIPLTYERTLGYQPEEAQQAEERSGREEWALENSRNPAKWGQDAEQDRVLLWREDPRPTNRLLLSVMPNLAMGPVDEFCCKHISYRSTRDPQFVIEIRNFDFSHQNMFKNRVNNPMNSSTTFTNTGAASDDAPAGAATAQPVLKDENLESMYRNASNLRDLAHWCRVFQELGVRVEEESDENSMWKAEEMKAHYKIMFNLQRLRKKRPPRNPIFFAGYLRALNRGGELGYYVLDSQSFTAYEDSTRTNLLSRYMLRDIMAFEHVDRKLAIKKCALMRQCIDETFNWMCETGEIDGPFLYNEGLLDKMGWEEKLMLIIRNDVEESDVAQRLLGAFGMDEVLISGSSKLNPSHQQMEQLKIQDDINEEILLTKEAKDREIAAGTEQNGATINGRKPGTLADAFKAVVTANPNERNFDIGRASFGSNSSDGHVRQSIPKQTATGVAPAEGPNTMFSQSANKISRQLFRGDPGTPDAAKRQSVASVSELYSKAGRKSQEPQLDIAKSTSYVPATDKLREQMEAKIRGSQQGAHGSRKSTRSTQKSAIRMKSKYLPHEYTGQKENSNSNLPASDSGGRKWQKGDAWLGFSKHRQRKAFVRVAQDRLGPTAEELRRDDTEEKFGLDRVQDFDFGSELKKRFYAHMMDINFELFKNVKATLRNELRNLITGADLHGCPSKYVFKSYSNSAQYERARLLGQVNRALVEDSKSDNSVARSIPRGTILRVLSAVARHARAQEERQRENYNYVYRRKSFVSSLLPFVIGEDEHGRLVMDYMSSALGVDDHARALKMQQLYATDNHVVARLFGNYRWAKTSDVRDERHRYFNNMMNKFGRVLKKAQAGEARQKHDWYVESEDDGDDLFGEDLSPEEKTAKRQRELRNTFLSSWEGTARISPEFEELEHRPENEYDDFLEGRSGNTYVQAPTLEHEGQHFMDRLSSSQEVSDNNQDPPSDKNQDINQEDMNQEYANQEYTNQEDMNQEYANQEDMNQEYANQEDMNQEYANQEYANQADMNQEYTNQEYTNQDPTYQNAPYDTNQEARYDTTQNAPYDTNQEARYDTTQNAAYDTNQEARYDTTQNAAYDTNQDAPYDTDQGAAYDMNHEVQRDMYQKDVLQTMYQGEAPQDMYQGGAPQNVYQEEAPQDMYQEEAPPELNQQLLQAAEMLEQETGEDASGAMDALKEAVLEIATNLLPEYEQMREEIEELEARQEAKAHAHTHAYAQESRLVQNQPKDQQAASTLLVQSRGSVSQSQSSLGQKNMAQDSMTQGNMGQSGVAQSSMVQTRINQNSMTHRGSLRSQGTGLRSPPIDIRQAASSSSAQVDTPAQDSSTPRAVPTASEYQAAKFLEETSVAKPVRGNEDMVKDLLNALRGDSPGENQFDANDYHGPEDPYKAEREADEAAERQRYKMADEAEKQRMVINAQYDEFNNGITARQTWIKTKRERAKRSMRKDNTAQRHIEGKVIRAEALDMEINVEDWNCVFVLRFLAPTDPSNMQKLYFQVPNPDNDPELLRSHNLNVLGERQKTTTHQELGRVVGHDFASYTAWVRENPELAAASKSWAEVLNETMMSEADVLNEMFGGEKAQREEMGVGVHHVRRTIYTEWCRKFKLSLSFFRMLTPLKLMQRKQLEKLQMIHRHQDEIVCTGWLRIRIPILQGEKWDEDEKYFVLDRTLGLTWYKEPPCITQRKIPLPIGNVNLRISKKRAKELRRRRIIQTAKKEQDRERKTQIAAANAAEDLKNANGEAAKRRRTTAVASSSDLSNRYATAGAQENDFDTSSGIPMMAFYGEKDDSNNLRVPRGNDTRVPRGANMHFYGDSSGTPINESTNPGLSLGSELVQTFQQHSGTASQPATACFDPRMSHDPKAGLNSSQQTSSKAASAKGPNYGAFAEDNQQYATDYDNPNMMPEQYERFMSQYKAMNSFLALPPATPTGGRDNDVGGKRKKPRPSHYDSDDQYASLEEQDYSDNDNDATIFLQNKGEAYHKWGHIERAIFLKNPNHGAIFYVKSCYDSKSVYPAFILTQRQKRGSFKKWADRMTLLHGIPFYFYSNNYSSCTYNINDTYAKYNADNGDFFGPNPDASGSGGAGGGQESSQNNDPGSGLNPNTSSYVEEVTNAVNNMTKRLSMKGGEHGKAADMKGTVQHTPSLGNIDEKIRKETNAYAASEPSVLEEYIPIPLFDQRKKTDEQMRKRQEALRALGYYKDPGLENREVGKRYLEAKGKNRDRELETHPVCLKQETVLAKGIMYQRSHTLWARFCHRLLPRDPNDTKLTRWYRNPVHEHHVNFAKTEYTYPFLPSFISACYDYVSDQITDKKRKPYRGYWNYNIKAKNGQLSHLFGDWGDVLSRAVHERIRESQKRRLYPKQHPLAGFNELFYAPYTSIEPYVSPSNSFNYSNVKGYYTRLPYAEEVQVFQRAEHAVRQRFFRWATKWIPWKNTEFGEGSVYKNGEEAVVANMSNCRHFELLLQERRGMHPEKVLVGYRAANIEPRPKLETIRMEDVARIEIIRSVNKHSKTAEVLSDLHQRYHSGEPVFQDGDVTERLAELTELKPLNPKKPINLCIHLHRAVGLAPPEFNMEIPPYFIAQFGEDVWVPSLSSVYHPKDHTYEWNADLTVPYKNKDETEYVRLWLMDITLANMTHLIEKDKPMDDIRNLALGYAKGMCPLIRTDDLVHGGFVGAIPIFSRSEGSKLENQQRGSAQIKSKASIYVTVSWSNRDVEHTKQIVREIRENAELRKEQGQKELIEALRCNGAVVQTSRADVRPPEILQALTREMAVREEKARLKKRRALQIDKEGQKELAISLQLRQQMIADRAKYNTGSERVPAHQGQEHEEDDLGIPSYENWMRRRGARAAAFKPNDEMGVDVHNDSNGGQECDEANDDVDAVYTRTDEAGKSLATGAYANVVKSTSLPLNPIEEDPFNRKPKAAPKSQSRANEDMRYDPKALDTTNPIRQTPIEAFVDPHRQSVSAISPTNQQTTSPNNPKSGKSMMPDTMASEIPLRPVTPDDSSEGSHSEIAPPDVTEADSSLAVDQHLDKALSGAPNSGVVPHRGDGPDSGAVRGSGDVPGSENTEHLDGWEQKPNALDHASVHLPLKRGSRKKDALAESRLSISHPASDASQSYRASRLVTPHDHGIHSMVGSLAEQHISMQTQPSPLKLVPSPRGSVASEKQSRGSFASGKQPRGSVASEKQPRGFAAMQQRLSVESEERFSVQEDDVAEEDAPHRRNASGERERPNIDPEHETDPLENERIQNGRRISLGKAEFQGDDKKSRKTGGPPKSDTDDAPSPAGPSGPQTAVEASSERDKSQAEEKSDETEAQPIKFDQKANETAEPDDAAEHRDESPDLDQKSERRQRSSLESVRSEKDAGAHSAERGGPNVSEYELAQKLAAQAQVMTNREDDDLEQGQEGGAKDGCAEPHKSVASEQRSSLQSTKSQKDAAARSAERGGTDASEHGLAQRRAVQAPAAADREDDDLDEGQEEAQNKEVSPELPRVRFSAAEAVDQGDDVAQRLSWSEEDVTGQEETADAETKTADADVETKIADVNAETKAANAKMEDLAREEALLAGEERRERDGAALKKKRHVAAKAGREANGASQGDTAAEKMQDADAGREVDQAKDERLDRLAAKLHAQAQPKEIEKSTVRRESAAEQAASGSEKVSMDPAVDVTVSMNTMDVIKDGVGDWKHSNLATRLAVQAHLHEKMHGKHHLHDQHDKSNGDKSETSKEESADDEKKKKRKKSVNDILRKPREKDDDDPDKDRGHDRPSSGPGDSGHLHHQSIARSSQPITPQKPMTAQQRASAAHQHAQPVRQVASFTTTKNANKTRSYKTMSMPIVNQEAFEQLRWELIRVPDTLIYATDSPEFLVSHIKTSTSDLVVFDVIPVDVTKELLEESDLWRDVFHDIRKSVLSLRRTQSKKSVFVFACDQDCINANVEHAKTSKKRITRTILRETNVSPGLGKSSVSSPLKLSVNGSPVSIQRHVTVSENAAEVKKTRSEKTLRVVPAAVLRASWATKATPVHRTPSIREKSWNNSNKTTSRNTTLDPPHKRWKSVDLPRPRVRASSPLEPPKRGWDAPAHVILQEEFSEHEVRSAYELARKNRNAPSSRSTSPQSRWGAQRKTEPILVVEGDDKQTAQRAMSFFNAALHRHGSRTEWKDMRHQEIIQKDIRGHALRPNKDAWCKSELGLKDSYSERSKADPSKPRHKSVKTVNMRAEMARHEKSLDGYDTPKISAVKKQLSKPSAKSSSSLVKRTVNTAKNQKAEQVKLTEKMLEEKRRAAELQELANEEAELTDAEWRDRQAAAVMIQRKHREKKANRTQDNKQEEQNSDLLEIKEEEAGLTEAEWRNRQAAVVMIQRTHHEKAQTERRRSSLQQAQQEEMYQLQHTESNLSPEERKEREEAALKIQEIQSKKGLEAAPKPRLSDGLRASAVKTAGIHEERKRRAEEAKMTKEKSVRPKKEGRPPGGGQTRLHAAADNSRTAETAEEKERRAEAARLKREEQAKLTPKELQATKDAAKKQKEKLEEIQKAKAECKKRAQERQRQREMKELKEEETRLDPKEHQIRMRAAVRLQAICRGRRVRRAHALEKRRKKEETELRFLQEEEARLDDRDRKLRMFAAVRIQAVCRGQAVRKAREEGERKEADMLSLAEETAANTIQKWYREVTARVQSKAEKKAAITIQRPYLEMRGVSSHFEGTHEQAFIVSENAVSESSHARVVDSSKSNLRLNNSRSMENHRQKGAALSNRNSVGSQNFMRVSQVGNHVSSQVNSSGLDAESQRLLRSNLNLYLQTAKKKLRDQKSSYSSTGGNVCTSGSVTPAESMVGLSQPSSNLSCYTRTENGYMLEASQTPPQTASDREESSIDIPMHPFKEGSHMMERNSSSDDNRSTSEAILRFSSPSTVPDDSDEEALPLKAGSCPSSPNSQRLVEGTHMMDFTEMVATDRAAQVINKFTENVAQEDENLVRRATLNGLVSAQYAEADTKARKSRTGGQVPPSRKSSKAPPPVKEQRAYAENMGRSTSMGRNQDQYIRDEYDRLNAFRPQKSTSMHDTQFQRSLKFAKKLPDKTVIDHVAMTSAKQKANTGSQWWSRSSYVQERLNQPYIEKVGVLEEGPKNHVRGNAIHKSLRSEENGLKSRASQNQLFDKSGFIPGSNFGSFASTKGARDSAVKKKETDDDANEADVPYTGTDDRIHKAIKSLKPDDYSSSAEAYRNLIQDGIYRFHSKSERAQLLDKERYQTDHGVDMMLKGIDKDDKDDDNDPNKTGKLPAREHEVDIGVAHPDIHRELGPGELWIHRDFSAIEMVMVLKTGRVIGFLGENLDDWAEAFEEHCPEVSLYNKYIFNMTQWKPQYEFDEETQDFVRSNAPTLQSEAEMKLHMSRNLKKEKTDNFTKVEAETSRKSVNPEGRDSPIISDDNDINAKISRGDLEEDDVERLIEQAKREAELDAQEFMDGQGMREVASQEAKLRELEFQDEVYGPQSMDKLYSTQRQEGSLQGSPPSTSCWREPRSPQSNGVSPHNSGGFPTQDLPGSTRSGGYQGDFPKHIPPRR